VISARESARLFRIARLKLRVESGVVLLQLRHLILGSFHRMHARFHFGFKQCDARCALFSALFRLVVYA
jgi:hypothetical protein